MPALDLGASRQSIEAFLIDSGYWGNAHLRERHRYVLSPSAYLLTPAQRLSLDKISTGIFAAVEKLNNKLCAIGTRQHHIGHNDAQLLRIANSAARGLFKPSDNERKVPPIIKLDLVQDQTGNLFVVEVDVYNPRALGTTALLAESIHGLAGIARYPGLNAIAQLLVKEGGVSEAWCLIVSEFERYYETGYKIFIKALNARDVRIDLVRETNFESVSSGQQLKNIFHIPDSLDRAPHVRRSLLEGYSKNDLRTFYPPVAYLGSKAFLPFYKSDEALIDYIPLTAVLGRQYPIPPELSEPGTVVIMKPAAASGAKGILFSDQMDAQSFEDAKAEAMKSHTPSFVLQKYIPQITVPIVVFDDEGRRRTQSFFLRFTAYISDAGIVDVKVTGRPDRLVHGAPDCVQLPTLLSI